MSAPSTTTTTTTSTNSVSSSSSAAPSSRVLTGKIALVTGASRGIGAAIARALAVAGADVAISYSASKDKANEVIADVKKAGQKGLAVKADHAIQSEVEAMINTVVKEFGRIDILVNNAGGLAPGDITSPERSSEASQKAIARMWEINVHSMVTSVRVAASHIPSGGRIINIGSIASFAAVSPGIADYCATKAAQEGYTKGWARDFASKKVTVNLIQPGPIDTDANPATGAFQFLIERNPTGRYGRTDEVAAAAVFLASPSASFTNAAYIKIDGGLTA